GLGAEDPSLSMPALAGQGQDDISVSTIQVLPDGNVAGASITAAAAADVPATSPTRWVENQVPTTLWSGPRGDAAAFTDLPAKTFLRVDGPKDGDRLPIYYFGDGLLRRPGNGWVEASTVASIDAPAPGQVPGVDAAASQPLPVWVQAHQTT